MSDTKTGPAARTYDALHHRQYVKTLYADAALAEKDARIAELEAERDAAWELVEELDPHHLKRNKMGLPREGGEG